MSDQLLALILFAVLTILWAMAKVVNYLDQEKKDREKFFEIMRIAVRKVEERNGGQ